jgi:hypothetical protein
VGVSDLLAAIAFNPATTPSEMNKLRELQVDVIAEAIEAREIPKGILPRPVK